MRINGVFAPLRGWYRIFAKTRRRMLVFAPLRGWYVEAALPEAKNPVFAPLRGWYTKYITEYRKMEELNA